MYIGTTNMTVGDTVTTSPGTTTVLCAATNDDDDDATRPALQTPYTSPHCARVYKKTKDYVSLSKSETSPGVYRTPKKESKKKAATA